MSCCSTCTPPLLTGACVSSFFCGPPPDVGGELALHLCGAVSLKLSIRITVTLIKGSRYLNTIGIMMILMAPDLRS